MGNNGVDLAPTSATTDKQGRKPKSPGEVRKRRIKFAATLAVAACGAVVLYHFDPAAHGGVSIYPKCLLHEYTGLYCPGCGAARAFHALLHGHLLTATHFNPVVTLLFLPVVGGSFIREGIEAIFPRVQFREGRNVKLSMAIAILVIVFSVLRNLPGPPFNYLAPPDEKSQTISAATHVVNDSGNAKGAVRSGTAPG
jgi:hypothetical protein